MFICVWPHAAGRAAIRHCGYSHSFFSLSVSPAAGAAVFPRSVSEGQLCTPRGKVSAHSLRRRTFARTLVLWNLLCNLAWISPSSRLHQKQLSERIRYGRGLNWLEWCTEPSLLSGCNKIQQAVQKPTPFTGWAQAQKIFTMLTDVSEEQLSPAPVSVFV